MLLLWGGCADDGAAGSGKGTATGDHAADPASAPVAATAGELDADERELLLRARGREWVPISPGDLEAFLRPSPDSLRAFYLWDASTGVAPLRELAVGLRGLDTAGIRVAVAVVSGGNRDAELVDLRATQLAIPAFVLPADGIYGFLPAGRLPRVGSLVAWAHPAPAPVAFPAATPPSSFGFLLKGLR